MCEFCHKHGEGKKWYLQTKNFVEELLTEEGKSYIIDLYEKFEEMIATGLSLADKVDLSDPAIKEALASRQEQQKQIHWGQVVPLEDVENILDLTLTVVRMRCPCRSVLNGVYDARFCFHFATFKSDFWPKGIFEQWPDWSRDLDVVTREEAKKEFHKFDRQGLVHTVWTWATPFVGSFCNCGFRDCMGFRAMERGSRPFFKAEYVAAIDIEKCNGCRDCMKLCNFGAIIHSAASEKCTVNQMQCFGCGLCRVVCPRDAITLFDRNAIPVLAQEW